MLFEINAKTKTGYKVKIVCSDWLFQIQNRKGTEVLVSGPLEKQNMTEAEIIEYFSKTFGYEFEGVKV